MATSDGTLGAAPDAKIKNLLKASREYEPLIPTQVVDYHLKKSGCLIREDDVLRVVALAAQRLASEIVANASARTVGTLSTKRRRPAGNDDEDEQPAAKKTLEVKELEGSLSNKDIVATVAPYYVQPSSKPAK